MNTLRKTLLAGIAGIAFTVSAQAAEFDALPGQDYAVMLHGAIVPGDGEKFQRVLDYRKSKGLETRWLSLISDGGQTLAGDNIARIVYENGINTVVPNGRTCASACVQIFAAGKTRYYGGGAKIGVHSAGLKDTAVEDEHTLAGTVIVARRFAFLDVPAGIIVKMLVTEADDIAWLSTTDMAGWATQVNGEDQ